MTIVESLGSSQGGKPLVELLKPLTSAESYQVFRRLLTPVYSPDTPVAGRVPERDPFTRAQMSTCLSVDTSNGRIDISNAGYVGADFDIGRDWWSEGLDELSGPARADEIAKRLADRFGGTTATAPTAVSQQTYDALAFGSVNGRWSTRDLLETRTQNGARRA